MNEKHFEHSPEIAGKYSDDFRQLEIIQEILRDNGMDVCVYPREIVQDQFEFGNAFPVANDGAQGIRVIRWRKGGLTVSFTNSFEDSNNPKRRELTTALRERGIDVV